LLVLATTTFKTQNLRGQTLLFRCLETGFVTTAPALGRYQRGRGIEQVAGSTHENPALVR
jgi:hypothetical protein